MNTREELLKKHQEELERFDREEDARMSLPIPAHNIFFPGCGAQPPVWAKYYVDTIEEAVKVLEEFGPLLPIQCRRGSFTTIEPDCYNDRYRNEKLEWEAQAGLLLRQGGGKGYYTAEIEAWPCNYKVRVQIEIKQFPWELRSKLAVQYDQYGNVNNARFYEHKLSERRVKYGTGAADAFDIRFAFEGIRELKLNLLGG